MLFNYLIFIAELREKEDKKEIVEKYELFVEPIFNNYYEQIWYKEYVSKFPFLNYKVPEELTDEFDWTLLQQIAISSFSSDYSIKKDSVNDELFELYLHVKTSEQAVIKKISELWSFQIMRLFEIYFEEHMNLQILIHTEKEETESINQQREIRRQRWQKEVIAIESSIAIDRLLNE